MARQTLSALDGSAMCRCRNPIWFALLGLALPLAAQAPSLHGTRPATLTIRNAHVVPGDGSPPYGPVDLHVRDGRIVSSLPQQAAAELDGTGCWVLPGLVNTHAHLQEAQAGIAMPMEYQLSLWLASGITTIRDVGSTLAGSIRIRR